MGFLLSDNQGNPIEYRRANAGTSGIWTAIPDDDPRVALINRKPEWQQFLQLFETPGNPLYESVLGKVAQAGFQVQNHWLNIKSIVIYTHNSAALAIAIKHLNLLLSNANQGLSAQDIAGWNALMDQCNFPPNCKLP